MNRKLCLLTTAVATAGLVGVSEARLPGTMNFANITTTNIHQTLAETSQNEKHVEPGDFDNDGDLDVVIGVGFSDFGARRSKLYRNDNGEFNEVTGNPIIPAFLTPATTRNAFFRDFDNDGWLDIWEVNDSNSGNSYPPDRLLMNKHPGGVFSHFVDEAIAPLRIPPNGQTGPECSAAAFDINHDGFIDFYGGNYPNSSQDRMWFNNPANPGFFTEQTPGIMLPGDGAYTVDVATADLNGDGRTDIILSSHNPTGNQIYYNNALNQGSGTGDLMYTNSVQGLGGAGQNENAMEPGDFDNDGRIDIYHTDGGPGVTDRILRNVSTNPNGQVNFSILANVAPPYVSANVSVKATVHDFNHDGRVDIFVMMQSGRPAMLRNTTVNGAISFVEWTPGNTFPSGTTHNGWHAINMDYDGDGWDDIFLGGWTNDHLFRSSDSNEVDESGLGGTLPAIFNQSPVAVVGSTATNDVYTANGIPGNALISVVAHSASNIRVELLNGSNSVFATSDRGGLGVEEAIQSTSQASGTKIRVTVLQAAGDSNNDGDIDVNDFDAMLDCGVNPGGSVSPACRVFDFNQDGSLDMADVQQFQLHHAGPGVAASGSYVLEALARLAN